MSIGLLDINFLIAIFDQCHTNHSEAHRWFGRNRSSGWATCPVTINGVVRILSNPSYPAVRLKPGEMASRLIAFCKTSDHHFWQDSVSLLNEDIFKTSLIAGHKNITDAYLLGLVVKNHGRLITFDRSIATKAVIGAEPKNLVVLGNG